jgi:cell division protease FtsH
MPDIAPEAQAREFAAAFRSFLDWIHSAENAGDAQRAVPDLIAGFLGPDRDDHSVVTRELPPFEHVNLQTALDAWSAGPGRTVEVQGLSLPPHHMPPTLQQLIAGERMPLRLTQPALIDLPNGPESTLGCLKLALLLVSEPDRRYVLMVHGPSDHHARRHWGAPGASARRPARLGPGGDAHPARGGRGPDHPPGRRPGGRRSSRRG